VFSVPANGILLAEVAALAVLLLINDLKAKQMIPWFHCNTPAALAASNC